MNPEVYDVKTAQEIVLKRYGLDFWNHSLDGKQELFETALRNREKALGETNYIEHLKSSKIEVAHFVNELTVNKTHFFRNPKQLHIFTKLLKTKKHSPVQILSIGCSTGEEPYSISMVAAENVPDTEVEISGIDINEIALGVASLGLYPFEKIKENFSGHQVQNHFKKTNSKFFEIKPFHRDRVHFIRQNLLELKFLNDTFDFVFLNNTICHIERTYHETIFGQISLALKPSGHLLSNELPVFYSSVSGFTNLSYGTYLNIRGRS